MTQTPSAPPVPTAAEVADPYALRPELARAAPRTLVQRLRFLGPGMLMSAAVVGSGELITTTTMGASVGFALLWLIILSTGAKVFIQAELAKHTILSGRPALQAFADVPPRIGRASWINVLWIGMDLAKMLQRGGIIGGAVSALSLLWPILGEPLSTPSLLLWTVIALAVVIGVNVADRYLLLERTAFALVVTFTVFTVILALSLPATAFGYDLADIAGGFTLGIPAGAAGIAIAVFGLTGVGADEMTTYTYWTMEKGYARWTGPEDGTPERAARARGWIRVMQLDLLVAWIVTTACTLSFYIMGAAVLHPQDLHPEGTEVIRTLSRMYVDTLGPWAEILFLIGAVTVLGSTFLASTASVPRLWANNLAVLGAFDWTDVALRRRLIRIFTVVMPCIWAATFLGLKAPLIMVMIGGFGGALFLFAVVIAVWFLRRRTGDATFRSRRSTVLLCISTLAVLFAGAVALLEELGIAA
ncbi:Nramp family divalent metal transporter [Brachybacterium phenoliresistens]|nr:Nramp family divalent metal transporter [Brachybacterium phenoliresistens]